MNARVWLEELKNSPRKKAMPVLSFPSVHLLGITVRELKVNAGAGFVVALTGNIMTMPGLPKRPAAEQIDVEADGRITGLF